MEHPTTGNLPPAFPIIPPTPVELLNEAIDKHVAPLTTLFTSLREVLRPVPETLEAENTALKAQIEELSDAIEEAASSCDAAGEALGAAIEAVVDEGDGTPVDRRTVIGLVNRASDAIGEVQRVLRSV